MDTGSVLGLSQVWSPFLVDLLHARSRQAKAGGRAAHVTASSRLPMPAYDLSDDEDDDNLDEDDDFDEDDDEDEEEEEDFD